MGTKHLTEADRFRARTLFFDAGLPKARICQITGFSLNQVKLAIREKTPKTRSGRPPRRKPLVQGAVAGTGVGPAPGLELSSGLAPESAGQSSSSIAAVPFSSAGTHACQPPRRKWEPAVSSPAYFSSWPPMMDPGSPTKRSSSPLAALSNELSGSTSPSASGSGGGDAYHSSSSSTSSYSSAASSSPGDGPSSGGFSLPSILETSPRP